ncbi:efflux RND transporter periplasmic adaptor subunit [Abyssisolibacter fermentans]|uniref:efflux RND transporter periplasmic adaptor subunit n=1 Tax=Abyssisolibacter fermentans TaxID=1766203 RepID=UPI00082FB2EE|nr:efflux RND transporter periplasmic adaptor subunit [Abyssisolibacter fermentans]
MKKYVIVILTILLTLTLITGCSSSKENGEQNQEEKYIPVEVSSCKQMTISNEITVNGKVYPDKDVMIIPKIVGKVVKINVEVGQNVQKDDVLFTLDKSDIEKQVTQAKTSLDSAKVNYERTREQVKNAKVSFERTKQLYEEGAISKAQYEQAELAASDKNIEAVEASVNQAQVAYDQTVDALKNITVKAPISGTIASVNIDEGEYATTAQPAITIVDDSIVSVQVDITEDIVNQIYKDKEILVSINAAGLENIKGKIYAVSPSADARTQLYPVKILLNNEAGKIKAGMFAAVSLNIDIRENTLTVPSDAVIKEDNMDVVYTVSDNKAVRNEVELGLDNGIHVEILSGLKVGDKVIIKGQNFVQEGSVIKVVRGEN